MFWLEKTLRIPQIVVEDRRYPVTANVFGIYPVESGFDDTISKRPLQSPR